MFTKKNHLSAGIIIPNEMIFSSASGLDPHISVEAAKLQVKRIAMAGVALMRHGSELAHPSVRIGRMALDARHTGMGSSQWIGICVASHTE